MKKPTSSSNSRGCPQKLGRHYRILKPIPRARRALTKLWFRVLLLALVTEWGARRRALIIWRRRRRPDLDGPLDGLIDQVFLPWLYILDELIYQYISDKEIVDILGEELGKEYLTQVDMKEYHEGKVLFEVLAGASLAAKKTMAQSLTLISQYLGNPQFLEYLADMGYYVDQLTLLDMWMMASEWKDRQDLIKPLTPQMEARRQQKIQQQQQGPLQTQMQP